MSFLHSKLTRGGAASGASSSKHEEDEQPNEAIRNPMQTPTISFRGRGRSRGPGPAPFNQHRQGPGGLPNRGRGYRPAQGRGRGAVIISTPHAADPPPPRAPERVPRRDENSGLSARYSPSLPPPLLLASLDKHVSTPPSYSSSAPHPASSSTAHVHPDRLALLESSINPSESIPGIGPAVPQSYVNSAAQAAASPPAVKRERTPTPPLDDALPIYKCSGVLFLPLPADCKRTVPSYRMNRETWKLREVAAMCELGITAQPEFIRDDGLTMHWTSPTPVMLIDKGVKTAAEIRVLHPPLPLQEEVDDNSTVPSVELTRDVPSFLRGLPADDPSVAEWIRLEIELLQAVDGLQIISTELSPSDNCLRLWALDTSEAIMEARQHQRKLERSSRHTNSLPDTSSDVHRIPIPAFIQQSLMARDPRGQLWIRLQVDEKETLEARKVTKQELQGDVLNLFFAADKDALPQPTSSERKRKRSILPVDRSSEDRPRRPPSPRPGRQVFATTEIIDMTRDTDEALGPLTPATTHVDDGEPASAPQVHAGVEADDRKLGLRFLESYFQAFDSDRRALHDAYAPTAVFSYQLHDLPAGTQTAEEAELKISSTSRDERRSLLFGLNPHEACSQQHIHKISKTGRDIVIRSLDALGPHVYGYNAQFTFDIEPLPELDDVFLLMCDGDILHVLSRQMCNYTQVFTVKKSSGGTSWPFYILSQHLTIRPKPPTHKS